MRRAENLPHPKQEGSALILSLIFIVMFAALATAMSGGNVQIATNQRNLDNARACAESGIELMRYWMSGIAFTGVTAPGMRFNEVFNTLQTNLANAGITNVVPNLNGSVITIPNVPLDTSSQTDDSGTSRLEFTGNVSSYPISQLPQQTQFEGLHEQLGTFILAPGFRTRFGGSFGALCGAIASNGIEFHGNAGGTINGSIINYSNTAMELSGNSDLFFNRSGLTEVPAGFVPEIIMKYDPSSYSEVVL